MTDFFPAAVANLLKLEGGYEPAGTGDPGGETNFGISKRAYPNLDIKNLTKAKATAIYFSDYWLAGHLEQLPYQGVATKMLDMCVNMGDVRGIKLLQQVLGWWLPVTIDGKLGPKTLAACAMLTDQELVDNLRICAADYYKGLAADHPALRKFLNGWLRRAAT